MPDDYLEDGNVLRLRLPAGNRVQAGPTDDLSEMLQKMLNRVEQISDEQREHGELLRQLHAANLSSATSVASTTLLFGGGATVFTPHEKAFSHSSNMIPLSTDMLLTNGVLIQGGSHDSASALGQLIPIAALQPDNKTGQTPQPTPGTEAGTIHPSEPAVPIHKLFQVGSLIVGLIAAGSLALWLLADTPVLHPAASLLVLVVSPFIYLMGKAAKQQLHEL